MRAAQGLDSQDRLGTSNHRLNCKARTLEPVINLLHVGYMQPYNYMLCLYYVVNWDIPQTISQGRSPFQNECMLLVLIFWEF